MTTVAILGTGAVGCALAKRLLAVDVPVRFGSRNPGHMGFQPYDAGPLRNAAALENLAVLWIHLARTTPLGREFSFQVVGRK